MRKVNLPIAIITIISLLVSMCTPIAYATSNVEKTNVTIETNEIINNESKENEIDKNETDDKTNITENTIQTSGEIVVVIDGKRIEGIGKNYISLKFSQANMSKVEIKRIYKGKLQNLGTGYRVLCNNKQVNATEVIKNGKGNITLQVVDNNKNVIKTVYIVKQEIDTTKYDITTEQNISEGIYFYNNKLMLEKNVVSYEFVYENSKENIFSDVDVTIENEDIAKVVKGENGAISIKSSEKIGETTATFKGKSIKNGEVKIKICVVESLYQSGLNQGNTTKPGNSGIGNTNKPSSGNTSKPSQESTNKPNSGSNNNSSNTNQDSTNKPSIEDNKNNNVDDNVITDNYEFIKYDKRENIYSDYTKLNEELIKQTDTLEVTVEGGHVVKADVFKTLVKYPNKKLLINSSASNVGKITWEFDSNTITNTNIDFKPSAEFSTEKLKSIKNNDSKKGIYMDLAHNGQLPGKASVSLWLGEELANKYIDSVNEPIYLYYYNPTTKKYEFVGDAKMCDIGTIEFELEHCSIYLFSSSKLESKTTRPLDEEPKTGVNNYIYFASLIAIISLAGIMKLKNKKI